MATAKKSQKVLPVIPQGLSIRAVEKLVARTLSIGVGVFRSWSLPGLPLPT